MLWPLATSDPMPQLRPPSDAAIRRARVLLNVDRNHPDGWETQDVADMAADPGSSSTPTAATPSSSATPNPAPSSTSTPRTATTSPSPAAAPTPTPTAGATSTQSTSTASTTSKRPRKTWSIVWQDFEELFHDVDGKRVRYAAICKHCKHQLSAQSGSGTGHLKHHYLACLAKVEHAHRTQTLLQYNVDGSVRSWNYDPSIARDELCRLTVVEDLPLGFGSTPAFERFIQRAHNPKFYCVSRTTTTRDFHRIYDARRAYLIESLQSTVSSVALTSDIWSGNAKEDYLSVVAHFVNPNWELEKRVIGMRLIDVSHSDSNIADRIATVICEFG